MEIVPATSKAKSAHLKVGKISHILPILLRSLQDPDEEVVKRALVVVSSACAEEGMFGPVMQELVLQFRNDRTVLQERGGLVVRQLCVCLGPHKVVALNTYTHERLQLRACMGTRKVVALSQ